MTTIASVGFSFLSPSFSFFDQCNVTEWYVIFFHPSKHCADCYRLATVGSSAGTGRRQMKAFAYSSSRTIRTIVRKRRKGQYRDGRRERKGKVWLDLKGWRQAQYERCWPVLAGTIVVDPSRLLASTDSAPVVFRLPLKGIACLGSHPLFPSPSPCSFFFSPFSLSLCL